MDSRLDTLCHFCFISFSALSALAEERFASERVPITNDNPRRVCRYARAITQYFFFANFASHRSFCRSLLSDNSFSTCIFIFLFSLFSLSCFDGMLPAGLIMGFQRGREWPLDEQSRRTCVYTFRGFSETDKCITNQHVASTVRSAFHDAPNSVAIALC